jgi:hypothetical protein
MVEIIESAWKEDLSGYSGFQMGGNYEKFA